MYNLFLDDQCSDYSLNTGKPVRDAESIDPSRKYVLIDQYSKAIEYINQYGCPVFISFDHDLGENEPTGFDFAKELIERDLDNPGWIPTNFNFKVHSANPIGKLKIESLLNNYLNFRNQGH